jgi:hypothetical protein
MTLLVSAPLYGPRSRPIRNGRGASPNARRRGSTSPARTRRSRSGACCHRVAAARDSATIKTALERSLQLDPTLGDAHFGIALYHYYADVTPTYAKLLRWMLLLPGGDRKKGLDEMREARQRGELLRDEADFQLQQVYVRYERRASDAIAILRALDATHPHNPVFLQRLGDVNETTLRDRDASPTRESRCAIAHAQAACSMRARSRRARSKNCARFANFFDFFCRLCLTLRVRCP